MILNFIVQPPHDAVFSMKDLVTSIFGLIGVGIGSWLSYRAQKAVTETKNRNNAFTAAILIRNWIREKLDYLINIKGNLTDRLRVIEKGINFEEKDHIKLAQDLPNTQPLYELDFSLIKDLSLMRSLFHEYENILQKLSLCNSDYLFIRSIEGKFYEMKNHLLINKLKENPKMPIDIVEPIFREFATEFQRTAPGWLEIINHREKSMRKVFFDFQKSVCNPLNVESIGLGEVVTTD